MACNCFETVNEKIREKSETSNGSLNSVWVLEENKLVEKPAVTFVYNKENKDGSIQKKKTEIEVAYPFCPFCGKKYDEETNEKENKE